MLAAAAGAVVEAEDVPGALSCRVSPALVLAEPGVAQQAVARQDLLPTSARGHVAIPDCFLTCPSASPFGFGGFTDHLCERAQLGILGLLSPLTDQGIEFGFHAGVERLGPSRKNPATEFAGR